MGKPLNYKHTGHFNYFTSIMGYRFRNGEVQEVIVLR